MMENMESETCPCAPRIGCPNCFMAREMKKMHNKSQEEAKADQLVEEKL
jgi:hypothetical protein